MSERLDLAEVALREAMGERLDGLTQPMVRNAARQILEAADGAGPRADLTERCSVVNHRAGRCVLPVGHTGFHQEQHGAQWFVAGAAGPRVTREMVTGALIPGLPGAGAVYPCALCGAGIPVQGEGLAPFDATERHLAWHLRLERLLEGAT